MVEIVDDTLMILMKFRTPETNHDQSASSKYLWYLVVGAEEETGKDNEK